MGYFNVPFTEANMAAFWMNTKFRLWTKNLVPLNFYENLDLKDI